MSGREACLWECTWRDLEGFNRRMWYHIYNRRKFSKVFKNTHKRLDDQIKYLRPQRFWKWHNFPSLAAKKTKFPALLQNLRVPVRSLLVLDRNRQKFSTRAGLQCMHLRWEAHDETAHLHRKFLKQIHASPQTCLLVWGRYEENESGSNLQDEDIRKYGTMELQSNWDNYFRRHFALTKLKADLIVTEEACYCYIPRVYESVMECCRKQHWCD